MQYKKSNILFFGSKNFDYLSDSLLIGLKGLSKYNIYEYHKNEIIYNVSNRNTNVHGNAFTLGGVIDPKEQIIYSDKLNLEFDYFIFASIIDQVDLFIKFKQQLTIHNTILLDGYDSPSFFPFYGFLITPKLFKIRFPYFDFIYFKREFIEEKRFFSSINKYIPKFVEDLFFKKAKIAPISFSIPRIKIIEKPKLKEKLFPKHIVDEEILDKIKNGSSKYVFDSEIDYYNDLQISKFCITTKRSGWDCMRHYEIAANGSLICFKNLHLKPVNCAPHGLVNNLNCINYTDYEDLMSKISSISDFEYNELVENSLSWVRTKTSETIAESILNYKI